MVLLVTVCLATPPVLVRIDDPSVAPRGAEHLGGPFYRVREAPPAQLRMRSGVRWAEADVRRRAVLDQVTDPAEPLQWHLHNDGSRTDLWPRIEAGADINATLAWSTTVGSGQVIAVLDTGVPADHPDLPAQDPGWDFVDSDADPSPVGDDSSAAHGTAVAALALAARNNTGVVGVCPGCRLLPIRVLAPDSTVRDGDLVAAILWAAERADVINASWSYDTGTFVPRAMHEAIQWAAERGRNGRGCILVFSAGNRGSAIEPFTPEAMVETITVGATDERDRRAAYSNHGPFVTLMAPGGMQDEWVEGERIARAKLVTADLEGEAGNNPARDAVHAPGITDDLAVTASFWGTSAATPLVSGAAALVLSVAPELTSTQVAWVLTESAANIGSDVGRVDAGAAVDLALSGTLCVPAPESCDNGLDDDCDRLTDALDPDCGAERPRVFELPMVVCTDHGDCGDGFCSQPDGSSAVRLCTAECDFDCPADAACVGAAGGSQCVPSCVRRGDCPEGTVCSIPASSLVPPGQEPRPVCLPSCTEDVECARAHCKEGACAGDHVQRTPQPPHPVSSCRTTQSPAAWLLCLWVAGRWMRRGRFTAQR